MDAAAAQVESERGRLLGIAYGLLGSIAEAEDVVQEAYLRLHATREPIRQPEAWLTTVATRIALDRLKSAQHRRETYPGDWLPEPVSSLPDPETTQTVLSQLSVALLHLLERCSAEERAVFVLREVFDSPYSEIAVMLDRSEAACRKLFSRAKKRLEEEGAEKRRPAAPTLVERFLDALSRGDEESVLAVLSPDAVLFGDGGGKAPSVLNPIHGADKVLRFFVGLLRKYPGHYRATLTQVNHGPALIVAAGAHRSVLTFASDGGRITALYAIANPDKLNGLSLDQAEFGPAIIA